MAKGNLRRVRERNGSFIVTIPSAFVAQLGLEDGTMMEIVVERNCLVMGVAEDDDGAK